MIDDETAHDLREAVEDWQQALKSGDTSAIEEAQAATGIALGDVLSDIPMNSA